MSCLRLCFSRLYTRKLSLAVKDHVDDRIQKDPRLVAIGRERNVKLHTVTGEMITNIKDGIGSPRHIEEKDILDLFLPCVDLILVKRGDAPVRGSISSCRQLFFRRKDFKIFVSKGDEIY